MQGTSPPLAAVDQQMIEEIRTTEVVDDYGDAFRRKRIRGSIIRDTHEPQAEGPGSGDIPYPITHIGHTGERAQIRQPKGSVHRQLEYPLP